MRIGNFVILSVLLVTKAAASCNKEDCETGLSVGAGVASVCATVGKALCVSTGWLTMGLSCGMGLACGVTAGVARIAKEACRACGEDGDGAGMNALSQQMKELSLTAKHILELTVKQEEQIQLTQVISLYGQDISNYQKLRRAFNRLSKNGKGLIIRNLDQESFEKAANSVNHGAAASSMQIFLMMTGGHPLKRVSIFQAVPESCKKETKDYFIKVMMDCYLLESIAREMRGESMNPTTAMEFKKQLILVENKFINNCGCPKGYVKARRSPNLQNHLASLGNSLPSGNGSSQVTYPGQPIPWFIMDDSTDRDTLKKISLLYSAAPFSTSKSAVAKGIAQKYRMEEVVLAQYLSATDSLRDLTLYKNHLFCAFTGCQTISGPKPNQTCVFPFIDRGIRYTGCTTAKRKQAWCSTATDKCGKHIKGHWGVCETTTCPMAPVCQTISGPKPNKPCVFPFIESDRRYTGCTTSGNGNKAWCSTLTTNSGNHIGGNWGNCDMTICQMDWHPT